MSTDTFFSASFDKTVFPVYTKHRRGVMEGLEPPRGAPRSHRLRVGEGHGLFFVRKGQTYQQTSPSFYQARFYRFSVWNGRMRECVAEALHPATRSGVDTAKGKHHTAVGKVGRGQICFVHNNF